MIRTILIGVVLVFVLGGCGNDAGKPQKDGDASLRVKHVVDGSQGLCIEGSVWHLRVVDASGDAVLDRKLTDDSESRQHLAATVTLKPAHGCSIAVLTPART